MTDPTLAQLETVAKALVALGALAGGAWAGWAKIRKHLEARRAVRALESKAIRYLLDGTRQGLHGILCLCELTGSYPANHSQLIRHRALIGNLSDELWVLDGHDSQHDRRRSLDQVNEIVRVLTRTQAIEMRNAVRQDMFREEDIE